MARPKSTSEIKSSLLRPAQTTHFEVNITLPTELSATSVEQNYLSLACSDASLPGSSLATFDINNDHYGVTETHAYRRNYDRGIDLTFYVNAGEYTTIKLFERWMSHIVGEVEGLGTVSKSNYSYKVKYPDEYMENMTITKFERDYDGGLVYQFYRCYPKAIQSMPVSYGDSNNLLKVSVTMSYLRYYMQRDSEITSFLLS